MSKQHWHPPAGWLLAARERGAPPEALAVLAQVGITTAGLPQGGHRIQRHIGDRLGIGRQMVCRWMGRLPDLPGMIKDRTGSTRGALRYGVPAAKKDQDGPWIWGEVLTSPAYIAAPLAWQWVFLGVLDLKSTRPGTAALRTTHRELAAVLGLSLTTIQDAIRYWRCSGLLTVEVRTGQRGQHLGLALRDAGRIEAVDVPATRPSRLAATRKHVAAELLEREDRRAGAWAAAKKKCESGEVWDLARELAELLVDQLGRAIPIGRIARALGTVVRSHVDRKRAGVEVERRQVVREDWQHSDERPAPWMPAQGPARLTAVPAGWSWEGALEAAGGFVQNLVLGCRGSAEPSPDGAIVWIEGDVFHLRRLEGLVDELREAFGLRVGMRPGTGPPA